MIHEANPHQMKKPIGIILSGGRGVRMEGVDKGLQSYRDRPLITWVIDALKPQISNLLISINRNQDDYANFGEAVVFDDSDKQWQGPIAGILAATKQIENGDDTQLLISPCDSPNISSDFVERLLIKLGKNEYDIAVVHDGYRTQNLHCLINFSAIQSLEKFYADGGRSMRTWIKKSNAIEVDFSDQASSFKNINTLKELA